MRERLGRWLVITVLTVTLLTVVGCCLWDDGEMMNDVALCFSLAVASLSGPLLVRLPVAGWALPFTLAAVPAGMPHTPAPPPKSSSRP